MSLNKSWYTLDRVMGILLALFGVLLIAFTYRKQINNPTASDLGVYLHAARLMLAEENIYAFANDAGRFYRYPPLFAFVCTPVANLPLKWTLMVWTVLDTALVSATFLIWYRVVAHRKFLAERPSVQLLVAGISLIVLLRYLLQHLYLGQANLLLLFLLVVSYALIASQRSIMGGLILGCSLLLKPFAVPFLIWYLVSARLRVLVGAAAGVVAGAVIPATLVGVDKNWGYLLGWVEHMMHQATPEGVRSASNNVSLFVSLRRIFTDMRVQHSDDTSSTVSLLSLSDSLVQVMTWGGFVAMLLWIGYVCYKYGRLSQPWMHPAVASFIFALTVPLTTTTKNHYFVVILPALVYVLHTWYVRQYKDVLFGVLVVASFLLLVATGPYFWPRPWVYTFQSIGLLPLGAMLLAAAIQRSCSRWDGFHSQGGR